MMNSDPNEIVQLQLWTDEDMPAIQISPEQEQQGDEQREHDTLAIQLFLPGFEARESN
jgi:hypothetical protein